MWPTPTPIPTAPAPGLTLFDPNQVSFDFTDWIIQGWNMFNNHPFATVIWFGLVLLIIYLGVMSIRTHLEAL